MRQMPLACPHCDLVQSLPATNRRGAPRCARCGAALGRKTNLSHDVPLAIALACIPTFLIANAFPLVSLSVQGATISTTLPRAALALKNHGMTALAILVSVTALLAPAVQIVSAIASILILRSGAKWNQMPLLLRLNTACYEWNMVDVLMLGMLVALGKLAAIADLIPGPALWAYGCLVVLLAVLNSSFRPENPAGSIRGARPRSASRTTAYLLAAAALYVPANILPIMHTASIRGDEDDTIMSGVLVLLRTGSWPLAALVFFASVMVPLLKLIALSVLVLATRTDRVGHPRELGRLYRLVEFVGRWSLLDIFALTLLVSLVQLQALATIEPRSGALAFAAVVVLTILSARSFDPRRLWTRAGSKGSLP